MPHPALRVASFISLTCILACGTKQPDPAAKTAEKAEAKKVDEKQVDTKTVVEAETKAGPSTEPATATPPAGTAAALTIRLQPAAADSVNGFEFSADAVFPSEPLAGIRAWSCTDTTSVPPPCGWAKLCGDLGQRWATQIGAGDAATQLANTEGYLEDCGDDGDVPYESISEDFVEHAAVIRHATATDDGAAEIVVQTMGGWLALARIREAASEGTAVKRLHEPRATWQLDLDGKPGKELAVLITGAHPGSDQPERFARLVVCRVTPEVRCRRIDLSQAKVLEIRTDGSFVLDGGEARAFDALDAADQPLSGSIAKKAGPRCKVTSGDKIDEGDCKFLPEGDNGSFSIEPTAGGGYGGATMVTLSVVEPGLAEVSGLTSEGINSRWGEARRSTTDPACWDGEGFSVCVYENG